MTLLPSEDPLLVALRKRAARDGFVVRGIDCLTLRSGMFEFSAPRTALGIARLDLALADWEDDRDQKPVIEDPPLVDAD